MIRPLRRVHLVMWVVLAVVLAAGLATGLAVRRHLPVVEQLPRASAAGVR